MEKAERLETRVLVLAPLGRDAALARAALAETGLAAEVCPDAQALVRQIAGGVGAVLLTQEALVAPLVERLLQTLQAQPTWSDLPIVVLVARGAPTPAIERLVTDLAPRVNATFLERPVRTATLLSAVRAALRARRRQYEVRDQMLALAQTEEALRASEARFRLALRRSPVTVFSQDLDLRYTWVYNASRRISAQALLGKSDAELLPPEQAARMIALKRRVLDRDTSDRAELAVTIDGQLFHWDLTVEPLRDRAGALRGVLGAAVDLTERRALERQQREFIAMVSHELRNPLSSIKGYAQLMQRRGATNDQALSTIVGQANILQRLVDDLLEVSRLDAGRLDLRIEPVDILAEARVYAEQAQAQTQQHTIRVESALERLQVRADRGRVGQVFLNVLSNAIKYSPNGGDVLVEIEHVLGEARVSISDRGQGIRPEELPRLFDRFYRADAVLGRIGGTGLGLYIARGIVEAHGGRMWAESDGEGRGSTFRFTLPLAETCAAA